MNKQMKNKYIMTFIKKLFGRKQEIVLNILPHILESTVGDCSHFYNNQGLQIRGFQKPPIKFKTLQDLTNLEMKYRF